MNCAVTQNWIHVYMDGELDPTTAIDIEQHLHRCPACNESYQKHNVSRAIVRKYATYRTAPQSLRRRIHASIDTVHKQPQRLPHWLASWGWSRFGPALACSMVIAWTVTYFVAVPTEINRLPDEIVSSHVRSLISSHLSDVTASDQTAVKHWFVGKLDFSPPVDDFANRGFSLVGGRIDYLKDRRVAALVYRHDGHPINVFVWPAAAGDAPLHTLSRRGYSLVNWTYAGMFFCAVSDLSSTKLAELARLLQSAG
jgi:mycothiol system anti-sigma-R factor